MKSKKPKKCCHPDCFSCPYKDCRYDRLEVEDYTESNKRDYAHYEAHAGHKLHVGIDHEYYAARRAAYQRRRRRQSDKEYQKKYYAAHRDEILQKMKENYDTRENTKKCRRYVKKHADKIREYQQSYYQKNREKKLAYARERYATKKESAG